MQPTQRPELGSQEPTFLGSGIFSWSRFHIGLEVFPVSLVKQYLCLFYGFGDFL
jgi:hypothetical protein